MLQHKRYFAVADATTCYSTAAFVDAAGRDRLCFGHGHTVSKLSEGATRLVAVDLPGLDSAWTVQSLCAAELEGSGNVELAACLARADLSATSSATKRSSALMVAHVDWGAAKTMWAQFADLRYAAFHAMHTRHAGPSSRALPHAVVLCGGDGYVHAYTLNRRQQLIEMDPSSPLARMLRPPTGVAPMAVDVRLDPWQRSVFVAVAGANGRLVLTQHPEHLLHSKSTRSRDSATTPAHASQVHVDMTLDGPLPAVALTHPRSVAHHASAFYAVPASPAPDGASASRSPPGLQASHAGAGAPPWAGEQVRSLVALQEAWLDGLVPAQCTWAQRALLTSCSGAAVAATEAPDADAAVVWREGVARALVDEGEGLSLLAGAAVGFAGVRRDVTRAEAPGGLSMLERSDDADAITSVLAADIDMDGATEILLGSYGREVLVYGAREDGGYALRERVEMDEPVMALRAGEFSMDGTLQVAATTLHGVHLLGATERVQQASVAAAEEVVQALKRLRERLASTR